MKTKFSKIVTLLLCVMMCISLFPLSALAEWNNVTYDQSTFGTNGYYNVISKKDYTLVPGAATETEMVLNNADGSRRQVMHIIEVDPSNPDVSIVPGYYGIDKFQADPNDTSNHKAAGVTNVAEYYDTTLGYQVVGAMNTALAYDNNAPFSYLVYNGEVLVDAKGGVNNFHSGVCQTMLCVYKDEATGKCSCELRTNAQGLRGDEWQAIGANFAMTVNNGELVNKTENHNGGSDDAARSMVGIKEDGTLVLVMNDGRGSNNSKGFCSYELGESMLALGCKWAFNCDGGGSSSFVTRRVGEENLVCRCVPCDGAERPTLNSVLVVSNVAPTNELDSVNIKANYDVFAPGTEYTFDATAIDTHGYSMNMPADAVWELSDDSFGTISNGTFASNGKQGKVDVQVKLNDVVVGKKTITVSNPTTLGFTQSSTVLPYGKSTTLEFKSFLGEEKVYLDGNSFEFALSNPAAGTLDGLTFTATTDETITDTTVTATYVPTGDKYTYSISFGKGSEIVWDFEDGELHGFLGQQDAYDWQLAHGVATPFGYSGDGLNTLINKGQISTDVSSTAFISTVENGGKVHNGEKALGYTFNMTQDAFNEWTYAVIYNVSNVNGDVVFRDVANGKKATTFGCWVYVPYGFYTAENSGALALQANLFGGSSKETAAQIGLNMQYNGKNLNALTEDDIPENRWCYVKADISGYNYVSMVDPMQMDYRSPSVLRMYVKPSVAQKLTYYFDDFTLDYSSAVDDRVPPVISNPQYAPSDTNIAFTDGVKITEESAGFTATISDDNSGIDASTAAIYVDGNKLSTTKVNGNMMFCDAVALGVGTHKVKFEIADNLGNYTTLTRTIISNTDNHHMKYRTRIELDGHNDSGETPMPGSVYYIDVSNSYSEPLGTAKFTLLLNTANEWILDGIEAVDGYDVSYVVNPSNPNEVTFTVSSSKMNGSKTVMFSIPVRVYNPLLTNGTSDGSAVVVSGKTFLAPLSVEMTSCTIAGSYGNYDKFSVAAMDGSRKIVRHDHTATAVEDKAATCTEAGYTGRTYCDVCQSVVDWGETTPATGHKYEIADGKFVCSECGEEMTGTGVVEVNGVNYYIVNGKLTNGWIDIDGDWYYFHSSTKMAAQGKTTVYVRGTAVVYSFDENGKLLQGEWVKCTDGYRYFYGPDYYSRTWLELDGDTYFIENGYRVTGYYTIRDSRFSQDDDYRMYHFDENGKLLEKLDTTGLLVTDDGTYYLENGYAKRGLYCADGSYYYFGSDRKAASGSIFVYYDNGVLPRDTYLFGEDGKMVSDGILEIDGQLYYFNTGKKCYGGLVEIDGEYYYANSAGEIVTGSVFVYKTNDLMPRDTYLFAKDGKMVRTGIYETDEGLCYYKDSKPYYAGLVQINGDYYYVKSDCKVVTGEYFVYKTNDLLPRETYLFGEDGKMVQGIYETENGLYYYENGRTVYAGLIEIDGALYYVNSAGKVATGEYFVYKTNDLLPRETYMFADDGKLAQGLYKTDDGLYYYENGRAVYAGLIEIDGALYYVNSKGEVATGESFVYKTNDLLPRETYMFANDGRLCQNGVYDTQDGLIYYKNMKPTKVWLVEIDGDYYYVRADGKVAHDETVFVYNTNDLMARDTYSFGPDGKMIFN